MLFVLCLKQAGPECGKNEQAGKSFQGKTVGGGMWF